MFILQQQDTMTTKNRKAFASLDFDMDLGGPFSFSDHDSGQVKCHILYSWLVTY